MENYSNVNNHIKIISNDIKTKKLIIVEVVDMVQCTRVPNIVMKGNVQPGQTYLKQKKILKEKNQDDQENQKNLRNKETKIQIMKTNIDVIDLSVI